VLGVDIKVIQKPKEKEILMRQYMDMELIGILGIITFINIQKIKSIVVVQCVLIKLLIRKQGQMLGHHLGILK